MASSSRNTPSPPPAKKYDLIHRGIKTPNNAGTLTFVGLRAVDPLLQYGILAHGVGSSLLTALGQYSLPGGPPNTGTPLDALGLSPFRLILFSMSVATATKHVFWATRVVEEEVTPENGAIIGGFNTAVNALNVLLFTCASTSASMASRAVFPQRPLLVGVGLFAAGLAIETVSEVQRRDFKRGKANANAACTSGLWSVVRHPNYLGYVLWRTGFATAAAGFPWGIVTASFFLWDFVARGIPVLEAYCSDKYAQQWDAYKQKTPFSIIPYVY